MILLWNHNYRIMKKIKIKLLTLIILFAGTGFSLKCRESDQLFEIAVFKVIKAFENKDAGVLNGMINKDFSLYVIHRNGTFDQYAQFDKVEFDSQEYISYVFDYSNFEFANDYSVKYDELPEFSCDTEVWTKKGLFCDIDLKDNILTRTAENLRKYADADIDAGTILGFHKIEKKNRRVVLINEKGQSLIFYLAKIKKRWYLTILDRVSGDCSA